MSHEVETMAYVGEVPWHGLGEYVGDEPILSGEMIERAGLGWLVESADLFLASGEKIKTHVANVRNTDQSVLGIVGRNYRPVQNATAFELLDSLVESGDMRYHTAGSLRHGTKIWALAKIGSHEVIPGDRVDQYLLLYNSHDGSGALKVMWTSVRVVCNNTANIALRDFRRGVNGISLKHTKNIIDRMKEAQEILGISREAHQKAAEFEQELAKTRMTREQFDEFTKALIPDPPPRVRKNAKEKVEIAYTSPEKPAEVIGRELLNEMLETEEQDKFSEGLVDVVIQAQNNTRAENNRKLLWDLLNDGQGQDIVTPDGCRVNETLWGARNAITEYVNYHKGTRKTNGASEEERRFESALFGAGNQMVQKADSLLWEMLDAQ